ncbi:MAG: zinc ribbon domain-containing protein [Candidatus Dojkabacteria bacterium]
MEQKFYKQCQSCGMPLEDGKNSGTEKDGSKSLKYCNLCYANGEFLQPDATMEGMQKITDDALKEKGWWAPLRWMAKMQIPSLERWEIK